MEDVLRAFGITGAAISQKKLSGGHIHGTYRVETADGVYIAQKLHPTAFPDPAGLMERLALVTDALRRQGETTLHFYRTWTGSWLYDGWRVMDCIPGEVREPDPEVIQAAGAAFGRFQAKLQGISLDARSIHDPARWFGLLHETMDAGLARDEATWGLADRLFRLEFDACSLQHARLPERVLHGDTKLNNLLFAPGTNEPLAVIDLDTVGMGLAAYDFGDAVRSLHRNAARLDPAVLRGFAKGYLAGAAHLTDAEMDSLVPGVLTITAELAARYLIDHMTGDRYFRNPDSLGRARSLTALAEDTAGRIPALQTILHQL